MVDLLDIRVDPTSQQQLIDFLSRKLPQAIGFAQQKGLNEIGRFVRRETEKYIESEGEGKWPKRSAFANTYSSEGGSGHIATFRQKSRGEARPDLDNGMLFLMKYFNWDIVRDGDNRTLFINFRESEREQVNILIDTVQRGNQIQVSELMKKAFSYTDFPLQKETNTIKIPAREIGQPVFRRTSKFFHLVLLEAYREEIKGFLQVG